MIPSPGRIVHYTLSDMDADGINRRRKVFTVPLEGGRFDAVYVGNDARAGDAYPAMIVRTWGDTEESCVQLQVFLDGNDTLWATSRTQGTRPGQWQEPPRH